VRLALDANRYSDLIAGDSRVADVVENAETVYVPVIVVGELRAGFASGQRQADNDGLLRRFLATDGIEVLLLDEQTPHHYANVYAHLKKQGTPIPTNDMWIAALALEHDLVLCSRDHHFDKLPQIPRI
jgi:tRNA(fMet)-specific endonuclease VapC